MVTGASRGIGYCTASQLIDLGYDVVITGRNEDSLRQAHASLSLRGNVRSLSFDSSDIGATLQNLSKVEADILVANVGISFEGSIQNTSVEDLNYVLANNLVSAFTAIQAVLDGMLQRRWGRIVTVGSMASHGAIRRGVAYTISKHSLLGLTRSVAMDTVGTGVTVNMVAPAFVRTEMMEAAAERIASRSGVSTEEAERKLAALSPENRLLEPDEVAAAIVRLVSDDAGDITGTSVRLGFEGFADDE